MSNFHWKRMGAMGGILYVLLQLMGQMLIQIGGSEPAFTAPAQEIFTFFINRDPLLVQIGGFLSTISPIPLLWFVGTLWAELQEYEQKPGWMAAVVLASGTALVAILYNMGGWELALFRLDDGLSQEMARTLFDQGNLSFANLWVAAAGLLLASSIIGLKDRAFPRWLSWFGLFTALGLIVARPFWAASGAVFLPYVLFWVWLIATTVLLVRRARQVEEPLRRMSPSKV